VMERWHGDTLMLRCLAKRVQERLRSRQDEAE
jgi:hypothetical protein